MTRSGDKRAKSIELRDALAGIAPARIAELLAGLSPDELLALKHHWPTWARPEQITLETGDWNTYLFMAGRGAGKTRAAAEWIRRVAREHPGCRIAIVARTAADARDVCIEGESGLLRCRCTSHRSAASPGATVRRRRHTRLMSPTSCAALSTTLPGATSWRPGSERTTSGPTWSSA